MLLFAFWWRTPFWPIAATQQVARGAGAVPEGPCSECGCSGPWEVWFYGAAAPHPHRPMSCWTNIPALGYFGEAVSPSNSACGLQTSGMTSRLRCPVQVGVLTTDLRVVVRSTRHQAKWLRGELIGKEAGAVCASTCCLHPGMTVPESLASPGKPIPPRIVCRET